MTAEIDYLPENYDRIKLVDSPKALLSEKFGWRANVVICPRTLSGNFDELANRMEKFFQTGGMQKKFKPDDIPVLKHFRRTLEDPQLQEALDNIMADMAFMEKSGAKTHLRLLKGYSAISGTHNFHIDGYVGSKGQDIDRYISCYNTPVTEFVRNDDVIRISGDQAECKPDTKVYSFHPGDMWKQRVRNGGDNILVDIFRSITDDKRSRGFVHRAASCDHARLMLVADHVLN